MSSLSLTCAVLLAALLPHCAPSLAAAAPPGDALAAFAQQMVAGCHLTASDGTLLFTPDGSHSYGAQ